MTETITHQDIARRAKRMQFDICHPSEEDPNTDLILGDGLGMRGVKAAGLFGSKAARDRMGAVQPRSIEDWCRAVSRMGREAVLRVAIASCEAVFPIAQFGGGSGAEEAVALLRQYLSNPTPELADLARECAGRIVQGTVVPEVAERRQRAAIAVIDFAVDLVFPSCGYEESSRVLRFLLDEAGMAVGEELLTSVVQRSLLHWIAVFGPDWGDCV